MLSITENQAPVAGVTPRTTIQNNTSEMFESFEKLALEAAPLPVYQKQDSQNSRQMQMMNKI